jgi:hypothetical protein
MERKKSFWYVCFTSACCGCAILANCMTHGEVKNILLSCRRRTERKYIFFIAASNDTSVDKISSWQKSEPSMFFTFMLFLLFSLRYPTLLFSRDESQHNSHSNWLGTQNIFSSISSVTDLSDHFSSL